MKRLFMLVAMMGFVAGCTSSSDDGGTSYSHTAPNATYGSSTALSSSQASTLNTSTAALLGATSTPSSPSSAQSLMASPMAVYSIVGSNPVTAKDPEAGERIKAVFSRLDANKDDYTGYCDSGSVTVTDTQITFDNCIYSDGTSYTYTINGWMVYDATGSEITWNIYITYDESSFSETITYQGDFVVTSDSVMGWAIVGFDYSDSYYSMSYYFGAEVDLSGVCSYDDGYYTYYDFTDGYYVVWIAWFDNSTGDQANYAYMFTWDGCGVIYYAEGTY